MNDVALSEPRTRSTDAVATWGVVGVLLVATLGDGGASVRGLLAWHAGLVGLGCALLLRPPGFRRQPASAPLAAFLFVAGWLLLGALRAPYTYAAWLTSFELVCFTIVAFVAAGLGRDLLDRLVTPLTVAAGLHGGWAVVQRVWLDDVRPASSFLNPNHLGAWIVAALLLAAGTIGRVGSPTRRRVLTIAAVPALAGLLVSGSRGALIAAAVGFAWLVRAHWRALEPRRRRGIVIVGVVLVAAIGIRLGQRLQYTDPFSFHRVKIWRASLAVALDEPWWGSGPGQFSATAARFQFDDEHGPLRFDRAFRVTHSDLLRVPAELGFPAGLAALVALALFVRTRVRRRGDPGPRDPDGLEAGATAGLVALAAQSLVDNPSRWPAAYLLAAALIGALVSRPRPAGHRQPLPLRLAAVGAVLVAFGFAEVGPTLAHLRYAELPRRGPLSGEQQERLESAVRWNPLQPDYPLRQADAGTEVEALDLERYAAAREKLERAVRLQPAAGRYWWGLGKLEGRACLELFADEASRDRAYARLELAQRRAPFNARIALDSGRLGLGAGDPAHARRKAEQALGLEPNAVPARLLLAEALLALDPPDAVQAGRLLDEAEQIAAEFGDGAEGGYAEELLSLDPAGAARVRDAVKRAQGGRPGPPAR